ncbi:cytochrome c biogenesis CcdA family protein [Pseudonocardia hydrocarbonoxydans]|uniref:cytochrome c biogenesis CcdA family protein n=1 Tax=Pseudonocardia hydrocarbonoxydans TaxID=76726 RepID=UPI0031D4465D
MELFALASLAAVAGAVSFSAPCVLPLLPGYVSYVSGLSGPAPAGPDAGRAVVDRARVRRGAVLFVAGFTAVFVALGATASALGFLLRQNIDTVRVAGGLLVVVLGLVMTGVLRLPLLAREARFRMDRFGTGPGAALPLGAAFAFGWTPCVGPVLASVLATAASSADPLRGVVLLAAYSLGLGVPFLVLAAGVARGRDRLGWLRRHSRRIEIGGGLALVATGVLMVTGAWNQIMSGLLAAYARWGWPPI